MWWGRKGVERTEVSTFGIDFLMACSLKQNLRYVNCFIALEIDLCDFSMSFNLPSALYRMARFYYGCRSREVNATSQITDLVQRISS